MNQSDPTAKAAIHSSDDDVVGVALAQMTGYVADFVVLHDAFEVPVATLVRLFKARAVRVLDDYDYLGRTHSILRSGRRQLRELLLERGLAEDELDWNSSPAVRKIGSRHGVDTLLECRHCRQSKIPVLGKQTGRPREYCSPSCKQAAYRERRANPATVAARLNDPENGIMPCFAGIERRIPIDIRFGLVELANNKAIRMEQVLLEDVAASPEAERYLARRWPNASPLAGAARAGLAYAERRGTHVQEVFLHGKDIQERITPYSVCFDCRYLHAMPRIFTEYGCTEWLEIPRPSPTGTLIALRINPLNHTYLATFDWK
ncbi:hypothetical protein ACFXPA_23920 [Amycolatopsis sp. NPDC059090]|uniref:hypothetical protein n=1 Tax=unclassified Amycolatopsis TaxID=2618356 RepID=UPI00366FE586